jgi:acyl-coenzyme A thioesterase PaaI-like protein
LTGPAHVRLYEQLGIESRLAGAETVETRMPVGEGVLLGGGLRAAPLGLALEHGTRLVSGVVAVPVHISVHVRDGDSPPLEVRAIKRLTKLGRTLMLTEGVFSDPAGRTIAFGSITWSVSGPLPEGERAEGRGMRPRSQGLRTGILETAGIQSDPAEGRCWLDGIGPGNAGPGGILHAGAVQLMCEEAALLTGRGHLATDAVTAKDCSFHLLDAGRAGPFTARASVLASSEDGSDCRVELRDDGRDGKLTAVAEIRVRPRCSSRSARKLGTRL